MGHADAADWKQNSPPSPIELLPPPASVLFEAASSPPASGLFVMASPPPSRMPAPRLVISQEAYIVPDLELEAALAEVVGPPPLIMEGPGTDLEWAQPRWAEDDAEQEQAEGGNSVSKVLRKALPLSGPTRSLLSLIPGIELEDQLADDDEEGEDELSLQAAVEMEEERLVQERYSWAQPRDGDCDDEVPTQGFLLAEDVYDEDFGRSVKAQMFKHRVPFLLKIGGLFAQQSL